MEKGDKELIELSMLRHSAAHVMADAVLRLFPGAKITIGPAIEDGFYYDFVFLNSPCFIKIVRISRYP